MILEFDNPWELLTPAGTLPFNAQAYDGTTPLGFYFLDGSKCSAGAGVRVVRDNIAQADGEIIHKKFKTGYAVELNVQLWEDENTPACAGVLREMGDLLDLHLTSILNNNGRLIWTPSPFPSSASIGDRMVDSVHLLGPSASGGGGQTSVQQQRDEGSVITSVTFALLSPFPYAVDYDETDTDITSGGSIFMGGNTAYYPVLEVHGPTNTFTITNEDALDEDGNPLSLVYDASLPGAVSILSGHYAEIDCFRNTVYLDGDQDNLKPGVDVLHTDFWPIVPGVNNFTVSDYTGSQILLRWTNAYA